MSEKGWWETELLRIFEVADAWGDMTGRSSARDAQAKADHNPNAEHFHCMVVASGMDDERFYFKTEVAAKENWDRLGDYLPEAHKRGIRVIVYFNVHWYSMEFGQKYPEWIQVKEDGQPLGGVYETGTSFCVNSPYRDWCFQILRDLCSYEIDGIFYDGPIFFAQTCYCQFCKEKFKRRYNLEIPKKSERHGPDFPKIVDFQSDSLTDFLRDSRAIIKTINPQIVFYMNGGGRGANWPTGRLNRKLITQQDILGSEGGFIYGDLRWTPLWKPGCEAKLLESQAGGKPTVIFDCAGHKSWNFYTLPEAEIELLYADTIANGANVWFAVFPDDIGQPELGAISQMNAYVGKNSEYYVGTKSEANVALVWSDVTANFYEGSDVPRTDFTAEIKGSQIGNIYSEFAGFYDTLFRDHIPFDVIDDVTLEQEDLTRYRLIFLPNVACMSAKTTERLRAYVEDGGCLVGSFETSLYNEIGQREKDFQLGDVFGVTSDNLVFGPRRWDYISPLRSDHPLSQGITKRWFPSPYYGLKVTLKTGESLMNFTEGMKGGYDRVPTTSPDPALVVNKVGNGRCVYMAGDFGNCADQFRFGEYYQLVENIVQWTTPVPIILDNAPSSLEVVLRSQRDRRRLLIHLVNFTGEMTRPLRRIIPIRDLNVLLNNIKGVTEVKTLRSGIELDWQISDNQLEFVVPEVRGYEAVVVTGRFGRWYE